MAKRKNKPAKRKAEPKVEAAVKLGDAILEATEDGVITKEEVTEIKESLDKLADSPNEDTQKIGELLKEEVKELEELKEEPKAKVSKHEFPTKKTCKHTGNLKRTLGRNSRVMHICPDCGSVVKFGGR